MDVETELMEDWTESLNLKAAGSSFHTWRPKFLSLSPVRFSRRRKASNKGLLHLLLGGSQTKTCRPHPGCRDMSKQRGMFHCNLSVVSDWSERLTPPSPTQQ